MAGSFGFFDSSSSDPGYRTVNDYLMLYSMVCAGISASLITLYLIAGCVQSHQNRSTNEAGKCPFVS